MKSNQTLLRWYKSINKRFFDGGCPERVCVRWADVNEEGEKQWEENYFGWAGKVDTPYHDYEIVMSRPLNKQRSVKLSTLCHEMCHLATNLRDNHGPAFELWRQLISDRGIYKKSALYKGLTLF